MESKVVAVRMPADVLEGIDGRAKNRSAFIVEAVQEKLGRPAESPKMIMEKRMPRIEAVKAIARDAGVEVIESGKAAEGFKTIVEAMRASRPAHAETCRCGICQLRRK